MTGVPWGGREAWQDERERSSAARPDSLGGGDKKTERAATKPDSQGGAWQ